MNKVIKHKDKTYSVHCFRISEKVYSALLELKKETMLSWNLIFKELLKKHEEQNR